LVLSTLAWVAEQQGRHARAARLFGAEASVWKEIGVSPPSSSPCGFAQGKHIALARAALGDDLFESGFQHGYLLTGQQALDYALENKTANLRRRSRRKNAESPLTPREWQVAGLIADGMSDKEIAAKLVISRRTAETHVEHILAKLGFNSRAQVAAWATAQQSQPPATGH
jgi:DNA-binding CsgD family transcriptional regulator